MWDRGEVDVGFRRIVPGEAGILAVGVERREGSSVGGGIPRADDEAVMAFGGGRGAEEDVGADYVDNAVVVADAGGVELLAGMRKLGKWWW